MSILVRCAALMAVAVVIAPAGRAHAQTGFAYQGRVKQGGTLITGTADFRFSLFAGAVGGSALETIFFEPGGDESPLTVTDGLFSAQLDFDDAHLDGSARWLEIQVRYPSGGGAFTTVTPRQPVSAVPYAIHALNAGAGGDSFWELDHTPIPDSIFFNGGSVTIGSGEVIGATVLEVYNDLPFDAAIGGFSTAASGTAIGVRGYSNSTSGWAGYFEGRGYFSGRVGIGTNQPIYGLQVAGFGAEANVGVAGDILLTGGNPVLYASLENSRIRFSAGRVIINESGGNVGIGTLSPEVPLHVIGDALVSGNLTANVNIVAGGNITATGSCCGVSDGRFKRDVASLTDAMEVIEQLRGVRYRWRVGEFPERRFDSAAHIGFIAQDLRCVLPEAVVESEDGTLAIDYGRVTPVLVEAVKELHEELRLKGSVIAAQQRRLDAQERRLAALESMVNASARNEP